jgi:radical SAM protein (TIGR01212 family)
MFYYNKFSDYLKEKYGSKVRKISLNIGADCPNRDGNLSTLGCFFCDYTKSGFEAPDSNYPIENQLKDGIKYYKSKGIDKLIAYFQVGTNTYYDLKKLEEFVNLSLEFKEIVSVSISTRPDCIDNEVVDLFNKIKKKTDLVVELGLQTVNYKTLLSVNRGHTLAEFIYAVNKLKENNIFTVTHVLLGLPGDNKVDVIETAKIINALKIDGVKLHSLYVSKASVFGTMYEKGRLKLIDLETYIEWVIVFLENLDPNIIIERLVSKPPKENILFSNWWKSWKKIVNMIENKMRLENRFQGKSFKGFSVRKGRIK